MAKVGTSTCYDFSDNSDGYESTELQVTFSTFSKDMIWVQRVIVDHGKLGSSAEESESPGGGGVTITNMGNSNLILHLHLEIPCDPLKRTVLLYSCTLVQTVPT